MSANAIPFTRPLGPASAREGGVPNPLDPARRIRAVLFDLDGTLYHQTPLRSLMAMELLTLPLSGLVDAPKRLRALRTYRRTQEQLRSTDANGSAAAAQLAAAARGSGLPVDEVERLVEEWMMTAAAQVSWAVPGQGPRPPVVVSRSVAAFGRGCSPTTRPSRSCARWG